MANLNRILELAGIKEKSLRVKQMSEKTLDELEHDKLCYEQQIKGAIIVTEALDNIRFKLIQTERAIDELKAEGINEELKQVDGKWALVSKKSGRPLRYYKGEGKPSDEWVKSQEKSVQYYKHMGEDVTDTENTVTDKEPLKNNTVYKDKSKTADDSVENCKDKPAVKEESVRTTDSFEQGKEVCANCNKSTHNAETCECECHDENGLSKIQETAPEDQEDFVKKSKADFKKRYGKRWKEVLYATAWKRHNEGLIGDSLDIADKLFEAVKDGSELQDSQPSAAIGKDSIDNVFDGHDEEKDNATELHNDAQGITQDRETKITVPADVFSQIDQRIKELEQSIELYDKTTYQQQYSNKLKAIENLEFIKEKLKMGNMEGYKQAQIHYGKLASIFAGNLFPAKLVDFLHDGLANEYKEVDFSDYPDSAQKPKESEVTGNSIYKTLNTSIYPQKGEDNVPKKS